MNTALFNKSATLISPTKVQQADGSWKTTVSSVGLTPYPCALQTDDSVEGIEYMRSTGLRRATAWFPHSVSGTTLSFAQNQSLSIDGVTYQLRGDAFDMAGRGEFWQVNLEVVN